MTLAIAAAGCARLLGCPEEESCSIGLRCAEDEYCPGRYSCNQVRTPSAWLRLYCPATPIVRRSTVVRTATDAAS
jgi:hypothetical protein